MLNSIPQIDESSEITTKTRNRNILFQGVETINEPIPDS